MAQSDSVKHGPPLPGELLAELLPLVGEINAVLDPDELLSAIAQQAAPDRRLPDPRHLPPGARRHPGARPRGGLSARAGRGRFACGPARGSWGPRPPSARPVFVPDVSKDPRYVSIFPGVVAELAIPLVHQDRLVGVLNVEGPDAEAFTADARTALQVLASHLAVAIENATLYRETRWYAGLLATLYEIGKETASILDLDLLLSRVAEIVKRVIDYEMFGILLVDEEREELVLRKAVQFGTVAGKTRLKLSEGLCGAGGAQQGAGAGGRRARRTRATWPSSRTRARSWWCRSSTRTGCVGVFDLESPALDRFTEEHVKVLTPLASQVAVAVENARLYEELRRNDARIQKEL